VKLEIVVPDGQVDAIVELIELNAGTGDPGDGKIFVAAVERGVRIRTGQRGTEAILPDEDDWAEGDPPPWIKKPSSGPTGGR